MSSDVAKRICLLAQQNRRGIVQNIFTVFTRFSYVLFLHVSRSWVYHNLTVSYGGWLTFGKLHIQAHVCSDGQHVWMTDNGGSKPQCGTDEGIVGSAWVSWCGIKWYGNVMQIGANMSTHAVMTWSVGRLSAGQNVDTQPWLRSYITPDYPNPIDHGVAGACDVWWTTCSIN